MLILSRQKNETIRIGDNVVVKIQKISGNRVIVGVEAPRNITVVRGEIVNNHEPPRGYE